jgi:hypothetical protein
MRPFSIDKKSMRRILNLYEIPSPRGIFIRENCHPGEFVELDRIYENGVFWL